MTWQDRQNSVPFDRSSSEEKPIVIQSDGNRNRMRKARIFAPRVAVTLGRATRTPISTALRAISESNSIVGKGMSDNRFDVPRTYSLALAHARARTLAPTLRILFLGQRTDVPYEFLYLFWLQALFVARHFVFAVRNDRSQFVIADLLHFP